MTSTAVDVSYWCERVCVCFSTFLKSPATIQHMLLYGPPGSGKTTSAAWLVDQLWKNRKPLMCMSLNAADERSLESIRQKIFPFVRIDWRNKDEKLPRFLVLDECETLTEAAQLSLQSILTSDPQDVCVILICNSKSRIHPKIRQRILHIRYDPPAELNKILTASEMTSRCDLRVKYKESSNDRVWKYLNAHSSELCKVISESNIDYNTILSELLLLVDMFGILDNEFVHEINTIYPCLCEGMPNTVQIDKKIIKLITMFRLKFDTLNSKMTNTSRHHGLY